MTQTLSTWFRSAPVDEEPEGWDEREDDQPVTERDVPVWDLP